MTARDSGRRADGASDRAAHDTNRVHDAEGAEDTLRPGIRRAFRLPLIGPSASRREQDEEIQFHIDMRVQQLVRRGMTEDAARREAASMFAGDERALDGAMRELHTVPTWRGIRQRTAEMVEHTWRDVRFSARSLRRAPSFVALVVITLAIGIGATSAIFSVVQGVLLRPLPYAAPERLVNVQHATMGTVAPATFLGWQRGSKQFAALAAAEGWSPTISDGTQAEEVDAIRVSAGFLRMMGARLLMGRQFSPEEESAEATHSVILSHAYWQSHFGGSPKALGSTLRLNGHPHVIVAIMPPNTPFVPFWAEDAALAVPLVFGERANDLYGASLRVVGRLGDHTTMEQAQTELDALFRARGDSVAKSLASHLVPIHEMAVGDVRKAMLGVMAAALCVLLIACANATHLQLLRNARKLREFAIRTAVGGTRSHLLRQSIIESLLLTSAACVAGIVLAQFGLELLVRTAPAGIPRIHDVKLDATVLTFTGAVSLLAALFFGALPAVMIRQKNLQSMLRDSGNNNSGMQRVGSRSILVASEFAMALVLLTTAGLVVRTLNAMHGVAPGFDPDNVLTMRVSVAGTTDSTASRRYAFFRDVAARVSALPGVEAASEINHLPLHGDHWRFGYRVDGVQFAEGDGHSATFRVIRPDYLRALRIPLVSGRDFTASDLTSGARVVIINQSMADRLWPGASALGKRVVAGGDDPPDWYTIVGVVRDSRQGKWTESRADEMYFPHLASTDPRPTPARLIDLINARYMTLVVRTRGTPQASIATVRRAIREISPDAAVSDVITMQQVVDDEFAEVRFYLMLFTVFGAVAVSLALIGVYGVLSYTVARRTREIGLRLALGATSIGTFRLVMRQGLEMAIVGAVIGIGGALMLSQLLGSILYGVKPSDPATIVAVSLLLLVMAAIGCSVPALRAARLEPMDALRSQ